MEKINLTEKESFIFQTLFNDEIDRIAEGDGFCSMDDLMSLMSKLEERIEYTYSE